jgi:NADH dehydrogenase/putative oxidoreductase
VAVATRIWLAQGFASQQIASMMGHFVNSRLEAPLGTGWWSEMATHIAQSSPGTVVQAACPMLLAIGLLTRPVAVAMLVEAVLLPLPSISEPLRPFWIALLCLVAINGPGALALDPLLGHGLRHSAVPGIGRITAVYRWVQQNLLPVILAGLRIWLAAALTAALLPVVAAIHPILPRVPAMVAELPPWLTTSFSLLLVTGLFVRPVALALFVLVPIGQLMTISDDRLYWLLTLAVMVACGGGSGTLDQIIIKVAMRLGDSGSLEGLPHVVIVGGGFGGIAAARALRGAACRVTLIDQRNFTLFQPLLYQVATAGLSPAEIAVPIRSLFRTQPNVRVVLGRVTGADPVAHTLQLHDSRISYDTLILSTGARHSYFGNDEWAELAPGLKSIEDATAIRHRLLSAFEQAENCSDPIAATSWLTFVIVGGGPTGVELAGAVAELARGGMEGEFRRIDPTQARVILIQSGPKLLPSFPARLSDDAAVSLQKLGVEVRLNHKLEALTADHAVVSGETISTRTVLWAAGVMASDAASWIGAKADRAGRLQVTGDLSVPGVNDVFAIGDTAASPAWRGKPVPGLAPAAKQGGVYVARVIRSRLKGRRAPPPFRYRHLGSLATIGRQSAVAEFGPILVTGALAWWLWGTAHIAFLVGGRNRVAVLIQWFWAYVTFRRGTRLITGSPDTLHAVDERRHQLETRMT